MFRTISYKVTKKLLLITYTKIVNKLLLINFNTFRCALDIHFRSHRGQQFFKCVLCDNLFNELAALKQHRELHNINEMVKCGICGLVFTEMYHMIKHKNKYHNQDK